MREDPENLSLTNLIACNEKFFWIFMMQFGGGVNIFFHHTAKVGASNTDSQTAQQLSSRKIIIMVA